MSDESKDIFKLKNELAEVRELVKNNPKMFPYHDRIDVVIYRRWWKLWKPYYKVVRVYNTTEVDVDDKLNKEQLNGLKSKGVSFVIYQDIHKQRDV